MPYADYEKQMESMRAYAGTPSGKAARARANNAYRLRNKEKMSAHNAVAKAILRDELKPWPVCAVPDCDCQKVEAHHSDYSRPLDVVWLCQQHHKQVHVQHRNHQREQRLKGIV